MLADLTTIARYEPRRTSSRDQPGAGDQRRLGRVRVDVLRRAGSAVPDATLVVGCRMVGSVPVLPGRQPDTDADQVAAIRHDDPGTVYAAHRVRPGPGDLLARRRSERRFGQEGAAGRYTSVLSMPREDGIDGGRQSVGGERGGRRDLMWAMAMAMSVSRTKAPAGQALEGHAGQEYAIDRGCRCRARRPARGDVGEQRPRSASSGQAGLAAAAGQPEVGQVGMVALVGSGRGEQDVGGLHVRCTRPRAWAASRRRRPGPGSTPPPGDRAAPRRAAQQGRCPRPGAWR